MNRSNIYKKRKTGMCYRLQSWFAFFIVGVLMGIIAFIIDIIAEGLTNGKWKIT